MGSLNIVQTRKNGCRDRYRDQCVAIYHRLLTRKKVKIAEIAEELDVSCDTVYRWIRSFGFVLDLRIERGTVIIGKPNDRLERTW